MKQKLCVELKDYDIEKQQAALDVNLANDGRNGQVQAKGEETRDVIVVDTREFSCLTPIYLAERGFWLVPMQLTVGDYVLSDQICVERKAVYTGDLFQSFMSGRLLQ